MKFPIYFTLNSKWGWMRSAVQNTVKGCSLPDTYHSCFAVFLWMTWACTSYAERQKGYSAQPANQDTWQCSVQPLHWITWELGFKNQLLKIENFESKSWILRFYIDLFYHWGKELGKCTHHWMTNDEKNTNECFRHLVSLASKRRKTDNNKKKQRMGQRNFKNEYFDPISLPPSPLSFASFCCCMSFFFYLTKTLSVKSARLFFLLFPRPLLSTFSKFFSWSFMSFRLLPTEQSMFWGVVRTINFTVILDLKWSICPVLYTFCLLSVRMQCMLTSLTHRQMGRRCYREVQRKPVSISTTTTTTKFPRILMWIDTLHF